MAIPIRALILSLWLLSASASRAATTQVVIPLTRVGNAGNPDVKGTLYPFGGVAYEFEIAKTEVSAWQYLQFLNQVDPLGANELHLYESPLMLYSNGITLDNSRALGATYQFWASDFANYPLVTPSWYSAARFANWMHNGQGAGDTETGSYTLIGRTPIPLDGDSIRRNPEATWVIPSIDEWFKAAFHKNDGPTGNYWTYPTSRDTYPYSAKPPGNFAPDRANTGNVYADDGLKNGYNDGYAKTGSTDYFPGQIYLTDVGAYRFSVSPYGTLDQFGNIDEWTETPAHVEGTRYLGPDSRYQNNYLSAWAGGPGFRLAKVPEPTSSLLAMWLLQGLASRSSRRPVKLPSKSRPWVR
ncbi:SUMF1/EgtB/PvdO family nonheme iron enzyme [Lacipirellula limnantheis]|uniref:Formylglycine-generating sulfatase enzyme n=1 Tax=Lacipirellula limnantheis TaxID=2528024 RepID=A0A517TTP6_9BACT|nr:SUMF1/EgtB/PvdO family nonheme iron enzyme [Lacipirellula limnantheis]QDT71747.1 Formylglycine-generating sulfatase enzyme [Lacipirellula limnantheis]